MSRLNLKRKISIILIVVVAVFAIFLSFDNNRIGGRTESFWSSVGNYIKTTSPLGYNVLINGTNKYLNFNALSGESGYGFRDNAGSIEYKDSGGAWAGFSAGSMTALPDTQIYVGNASNEATATSSVTVNSAGTLSASGGTSLEWTTAYGWGDHSGLYDVLGQATSTLASHTTTYNHANYDTAYGWGDHAGLYLPISGGVLTGSTTVDGNFTVTGSTFSLGSYGTIESKLNPDTEESITLSSTQSVDVQLGVSGYYNVYNSGGEVLFYTQENNGLVTVVNNLSVFGDTKINGTATTTNLTVTANSKLGTIISGTWNGTAIDFSDYTNATAGTGITFTGDEISTSADQPNVYRYFTFTISTSTQDYLGNPIVAGATSTVRYIAPYPQTIDYLGYKTSAGTAGINMGDGTNWSGYKSAGTTFASSTVSTNNSFTQGETWDFQVNLSGASTVLNINGQLTTD